MAEQLSLPAPPRSERRKFRARDGWGVNRVRHGLAADLVRRLHYSRGASNTSVLAAGLLSPEQELVGAALWMPPPPGSAGWLARVTGCSVRRTVTLSRMVVEDEVPRNAASYLLSRSIRMLREDGYEVAVTFADAVEGHTGHVYLASNWVPAGTTLTRKRWVDADGVMRSRKSTRNLTADEMRARGWVQPTDERRKHRYLYAIDRRYRAAVEGQRA